MPRALFEKDVVMQAMTGLHFGRGLGGGGLARAEKVAQVVDARRVRLDIVLYVHTAVIGRTAHDVMIFLDLASTGRNEKI